MKEDFLHYVWKFQKFKHSDLTTTNNESITIDQVGQLNSNAGPDFFNARILVDDQLWAGNVEIHIKSSDWYLHRHEQDDAYDNVVLHVVYEHDTEIYRKDNSVIPTIILKDRIEPSAIKGYKKLFSREPKWINCEYEFAEIDSFLLSNWLDRLYFERLEQKSKFIYEELKASKNNWEAVLFQLLAKGFGLKVNAESFFSVASSVDFSIIKKCSQEKLALEALLFGQAGILSEKKNEKYHLKLREKYSYLRHKFRLQNEHVIAAKFFRLRPPNFPTIRLSQLATLYSTNQNLFSKIIETNTLEEFYTIFHVAANTYWDQHFNFGVLSNNRRKGLTKKFIDLLLLNVIIPLKFCHAQHEGKDHTEQLTKLVASISPEQNSLITKFKNLRPMAQNAMHTQSIIHLKNNYCDAMRCMDCAIGNMILSRA